MSDPSRTLNGFSRLQIQDWRQFASIDLEFHPRLTILTGANGAGKTSLLSILGRHFNWGRTYLNIQPLDQDESRRAYKRRAKRIERGLREGEIPAGWESLGHLYYRNGTGTAIAQPEVSMQSTVGQYDLAIFAQQNFPGLYLSSHRQLSVYQPVTQLSLNTATPEQLLGVYSQELRQRQYSAGAVVIEKTPMNHMKQGLIASAIYGEGNSAVVPNPQSAEIWSGFQAVLSILFPSSLGYLRLHVQGAEVIVETTSGQFPIDEVSGGLSAIIELAWQIFLTTVSNPQCTIVFDEPENHLHPQLQQNLLPDLLAAFPEAQFVVATHSPFVVTASPDSAVYVLDYRQDPEDGRRVYSRLLDQENKAADADEVLRRTLGVGSTLPLWAQHRFESIIADYARGDIDTEKLRGLRESLEKNGLEKSFPEALRALKRATDT